MLNSNSASSLHSGGPRLSLLDLKNGPMLHAAPEQPTPAHSPLRRHRKSNKPKHLEPLSIIPPSIADRPDFQRIDLSTVIISNMATSKDKFVDKSAVASTSHRALVHYLSRLDFFHRFSITQMESLVRILDFKALQPQEWLFHKGDEPDGFYVVLEGSVAVYLDDEQEPVRTLVRGESFGELALINDDARKASIRATDENCMLAVFWKEDYKKKLRDIQVAELKKTADFIQVIKPFMNFSRRQVLEIAGVLHAHVIRAHQKIIDQYDLNTVGFYIVKSGYYKVYRHVEFIERHKWPVDRRNYEIKENKVVFPVELSSLGPGDTFGERVMIGGADKAVSVVSITAGEVLVLTVADFRKYMKDSALKYFTDRLEDFPSDDQIRRQYNHREHWHKFKHELLSQITTKEVSKADGLAGFLRKPDPKPLKPLNRSHISDASVAHLLNEESELSHSRFGDYNSWKGKWKSKRQFETVPAEDTRWMNRYKKESASLMLDMATSF